nr:MAG TPA: hypothetical protein [Caudoviricetes sp.]
MPIYEFLTDRAKLVICVVHIFSFSLNYLR